MVRSVLCPRCGQRAVITLYEDPDEGRGTEGHRIEIRCLNPEHRASEPELLRLWAAARFAPVPSERLA